MNILSRKEKIIFDGSLDELNDAVNNITINGITYKVKPKNLISINKLSHNAIDPESLSNTLGFNIVDFD